MSDSVFAGLVNAVNFAYGSEGGPPAFHLVRPVAAGDGVAYLDSAELVLSDGTILTPAITDDTPILIDAEELTATSAQGNAAQYGGFSINATFAATHGAGAAVKSATFGLQEALNFAALMGGGAVIIDAAWVAIGGTTGIKDAATVPAGVTLQDNRQGAPFAGGGGSITVGAYAALPVPGNAGALYIQTDGPYTFFDNGVSWDAFLTCPGGGQIVIPDTTGFAWHTASGSPTASDTYGPVQVSLPSANDSYRYYTKGSIPGTYTITALVDLSALHNTTQGLAGIGLWQSSDNKGIIFALIAAGVLLQKTTTTFTFSGTVATYSGGWSRWGWLRIQRDGTNNIFSFSVNGRDWVVLATEARDAYITADEYGGAFYNNTGSEALATILSFEES